MICYDIAPGGRLAGEVPIPGDKSISHRAVMLGALAEGETVVEGLLEGEDVRATVGAFRALGVAIEGPVAGRLAITGAGMAGLKRPGVVLDMGNSGTALRLVSGILAAQPFDSRLTGDESLRRRPMRRVAEPLVAMGARVETSPEGTPPLVIHGGRILHGIDYVLPVPSAQVKSAVLLAGLYARGETVIHEPAPSRDHTERMLRGFGYEVDSSPGRVALRGGGRLVARHLTVPSDLSSAAFFLVGAAIVPGSELILPGVGVNPTRTGILELLSLMGADIRLEHRREVGGEPVADLFVRGGGLKGIEVPESLVPLAIDEFPAFFIAAACAKGRSVVRGASELRVKETDRIGVAARALAALGITVEERADGVVIEGGRLGAGTVDSGGDHRIAMAFAMAGLAASGPITVLDCKNVDTSFPGFVELARTAGLGIAARIS
ncbi:MAG: 3-phosphoshikimate 1-carboxyvinyltransferase [Acidiferrobacteraceae bacterium]